MQADDSPAGLASGAHCLPAGAWSTRRQTAPHAPPPPQTQRHPSSAHATHTGTAVSPSRATAGFGGCQQSGTPSDRDSRERPTQSSRAGTVALTVGLVVLGRR